MSTMSDQRSYTNNSGLYGFQIQVQCEPVDPSEVNEGDLDTAEEENSEDHWLKWSVVSGFFLGFCVAVPISYFTGFLNPNLPRQYLRGQTKKVNVRIGIYENRYYANNMIKH
jgi:hypothetical protein